MRRNAFLLPLFLILLALLAACGTKGEGKETETIPDGEGVETGMKEYVEYTGGDTPLSMPLDGKWLALYDENGTGRKTGLGEGKWTKTNGAVEAAVPGNFYQLSDPIRWGSWWFRREFTPDLPADGGMRYYLRFGAVDYYCEVYLNGTLLGSHEGKGVGFDLDATSALKTGEKNVLVVLVFQPGGTGATLDGMKCGNIPKGLVEIGGINRSVSLYAAGKVPMEDVFCAGDWQTGLITSALTLFNPSENAEKVFITVSVSEAGSGICQFSKRYEAEAAPGRSTVKVESQLKEFRLWNTDDPALYNVHITVDVPSATGAAARSEKTVRIGFRDFRVKDGWFFLNGKRILLKCSHQGQTQPTYCYYQAEDSFGRRDILNLKETGFNCVRFLCAPATPVQLDLCDELGLMVYQEHTGSWNWYADDADWQRRFTAVLNNQIVSDRSHPSVVIWGLLNETTPQSYCDYVQGLLPEVRALDPTRLILFNSGRFDGQLSVGSLSNPGSDKWEGQWGKEEKMKTGSRDAYFFFPEYYTGCGDIHLYPREMPQEMLLSFFLTLGGGGNPLFLSEGGVGSAYNAIAGKRYAEQTGAAANTNLVTLSKAEENILRAFLKEYDLSAVYPVAEDYYTDADRAQAKQRRQYLDLLRCNPNIAGYSMTSALDEAFAAEGIFGFERQFKTGQAEVVQNGNAALKWCLFALPQTVYTTDGISLRAVLASEDALQEGTYDVTLRVFGDEGIVWQREKPFTVKKDGDYLPLSFEVFAEDIHIDGLKEGTYTFSAELNRGGWATCDRTEFHVLDKKNHKKLSGTVYTLGTVDNEVSSLLTEAGATVVPLSLSDPMRDYEVILVGKDAVWAEKELAALYTRIASGSHAVFLYPAMLAGKTELKYVKTGTVTERTQYLLTEEGKSGCDLNLRWNWLYHSNAIAKNGPLTEGLGGRGIMDLDYYGGALTDRMYFSGIGVPDCLGIAEFGVGIQCYSTETVEGTVLGTFDFFGGSYTLSGLALAENVGHPAADRLLCGIFANAASLAEKTAPVTPDAEKVIRDAFPG